MNRWWSMPLTLAALAVLFLMALLVSPPPSPPSAPAVLVPLASTTPVREKPFTYIEVSDGCGAAFSATCVVARTGPGTEYRAAERLRMGTVLAAERVLGTDGSEWFRVQFNEWLRYPERVSSTWYVSGAHVRVIESEGPREFRLGVSSIPAKRIIVDLSAQTLSAYEGDSLFMQERISSGIAKTPTPRGTFTVYKKTPSRYMQGPIPGISTKEYDLPGVPWNLYFTNEGAVIHGAYWHSNFGKKWSNGCVNLPVQKAEQLYLWADVGTLVVVRD